MDLRGSVPTLLGDKQQKPESGGCSAPDTALQVSRTEKQPVDYTNPPPPGPAPAFPGLLWGFIPTP